MIAKLHEVGLGLTSLGLLALALGGCHDGGRGRGHAASDAGRAIDAGCGERTDDASVAACAAPSGTLAAADVGSACELDGQCKTGRCLQSIAVVNVPYPGGYCSGPCSADRDCGPRAVCVPGLRGMGGSCYLSCDEADGCGREGYICRVVSGVGRCIPGPKPLPDHIVGSACSDDADCGGGPDSCANTFGALAAPGGYCSQACAIDGDCGAGGQCINGISIVTVTSGRCYRVCETSADCRTDYECKALSGAVGGPGVCVTMDPSDSGVN